MWPEDDWECRLIALLKERGYDGVTEFLRRHPGIPYVDLARTLGSGVAAVQLIRIQLAEAIKSGELRTAAMDSLVRCLRRGLAEGWVVAEGKVTDFATASAFGDWIAYLKVHGRNPKIDSTAKRIWEALIESRPPIGWKPEGPTDPIIVQAFERAWPKS